MSLLLPPEKVYAVNTSNFYFPEYLLQIKKDNNAMGEPGGTSLQSNS